MGIDKALVAAIMSILYIVQTYTGLSLWWATPDTIATIIGLLTPVLVPGFPNKKVAGVRVGSKAFQFLERATAQF